jgi:hypothetical protein
MLLPSAFYAHGEAIAQHLPHLRPSQSKGLALWVGGTLLAHSGCQNAVLGALLTLGLGWHATRQYLREWLYDGSDRAAPCRVQLDVDACFAPLLRWVLAWWEGTELTLAIDPTSKGADLVALVVQLYAVSVWPSDNPTQEYVNNYPKPSPSEYPIQISKSVSTIDISIHPNLEN